MDAVLRAGAGSKTLREMSAEVGVSFVSVRRRVYKLGLGAEYERRGACGFGKGWEPWQEQLVRDHWDDWTTKAIAAAVGKSETATSKHALENLGLGKKRHQRSVPEREPEQVRKRTVDQEKKDATKSRRCQECVKYPCFKGQQEARHDYNFAANGCRLYRKRE